MAEHIQAFRIRCKRQKSLAISEIHGVKCCLHFSRSVTSSIKLRVLMVIILQHTKS